MFSSRRKFLVLISAFVATPVVLFSTQKFVKAQVVKGRKLKITKIRNNEVQIEEGGEKGARITVRGNKRARSFEAVDKGNKYITGYFPFGEEFSSLEDLTASVIESGQLDID